MKINRAFLLLAFASVVFASGCSSTRVTGLQCEYVQNPLGIDELKPRLSWRMESAERGQKQTAYRILVSDSSGELWDTGKVVSDQSIQVEYAGKQLQSHQVCSWKVQVWDKDGEPIGWSEPAHWSMGILNRDEWGGKWLAFSKPIEHEPDPLMKKLTWGNAQWIWVGPGDARKQAAKGKRFFRKTVTLPEDDPVAWAYMLAAADDYFRFWANGSRIGESVKGSNAWKRAYAIEMTETLKPGTNLLAVDTENTETGSAGLAANLVVQLVSGRFITVQTDATWKGSVKGGKDWQKPECDDSKWPSVSTMGKVGIKPWDVPKPGTVPGWSQKSSAPMFRKEFTVGKPVKRATATICGLGYHELSLNGKKVGNHVLDPAFTRYDRRSLYVTHDVTDELTQGVNALGVMLGNGWYNMHTRSTWNFDQSPWRDEPAMLMQLRIEFEDGSVQTVASDGSWRANTGPVVLDSVRTGEVYDARKEMPGWDTAGFNDSKWAQPRIVKGPEGKLSAQMMPPMRVTETIKPVKITEPREGIYIFDLGQVMPGWVQLHVSGPAGTRVTMRYSERLENGMIERHEIDKFGFEGPFQTDTYILKGDGREVWEPRFTYHGFRYVEVTGFPGTPTLDSLCGRVVHTDFKTAGSFECSNELLNTIQQLTRWSYRGNYHGYPTDCPQREKNGWTGDAQLAAEQAMFNFHNAGSYIKWIQDIADEQREDGAIPAIVPTSGWGYHWGNGPAWDSAFFLVPWYQYLYKGDARILTRHLDSFQQYVDYLTAKSKNHIVKIGLGDWAPADTVTPAVITSTGYYYVDTLILAETARLAGKKEMAATYAERAKQIRAAFNKEFYKGDGVYLNGSQTALSCAMYQGMAEEPEKAKVLEKLVADIERKQGHLDVGILGAKYLFHTLSENGLHDVAWQVATQTTPPSYGAWVEQGATTLWEHWDGHSSLNHIMFGDISAWFYQKLAGIRPDPQHPGFKNIILRPQPVGDLISAKAIHESMYGGISSSWKLTNGRFVWDVVVPPNTTATVHVPAGKVSDVTESGKPVNQVAGLEVVRADSGDVVLKAVSGRYRFVSKADG